MALDGFGLQPAVAAHAAWLSSALKHSTMSKSVSVMRVAQVDLVRGLHQPHAAAAPRVVSSRPWAASCCTIFVRWLREMPCASATLADGHGLLALLAGRAITSAHAARNRSTGLIA